jgi:hypothetical protein
MISPTVVKRTPARESSKGSVPALQTSRHARQQMRETSTFMSRTRKVLGALLFFWGDL